MGDLKVRQRCRVYGSAAARKLKKNIAKDKWKKKLKKKKFEEKQNLRREDEEELKKTS